MPLLSLCVHIVRLALHILESTIPGFSEFWLSLETLNYKGWRFPKAVHTPATLDRFLAYEPTEDDVIVATHPKCGTHWVTQMLLQLASCGQLDAFPHINCVAPWIDSKCVCDPHFYPQSPYSTKGTSLDTYATRPRIIKTHNPRYLTPFSSKAKYVVVCRNSFDVMVSMYHHASLFIPLIFLPFFPSFVRLFLRQHVEWNDGWWHARNEPNVLILHYEDIKADPRQCVERLAEFLHIEGVARAAGQQQQQHAGLIEAALHRSSFQYMKERGDVFSDFVSDQSLIRTGKVGGFAELFTPRLVQETYARLEAEYARRGSAFPWRARLPAIGEGGTLEAPGGGASAS